MSAARGDFTRPGKDSPWRNRSVDENLALLRAMREGKYRDGEHVLRAKIDMKSPNLNLRDPVMYRIRHAHHHRTGDKWCIYPTYDWAHGLSDCIERISHSLCTLEFEDHRPLYDWFNQRVAEAGLLQPPLSRQIEFARLNLTYVILSKRKLIQLVERTHRRRLGRPAHAHARRRAPPRLYAGGLPPVRRAHRRVEGAPGDRLRHPRGVHARAPERHSAAAHGGARPGEARDRRLPRGQGRDDGAAEPSAEARSRQAQGPLLTRALDRARGLPGEAGERLFPPLPGKRSPAALRLRGEVHRHEGRHRALHAPSGFALRLARRRKVQGEGQHSLGERKACPRGEGAALRPAVQGAGARQGARFPRGHQPGLAQAGRCAVRTQPCETRTRGRLISSSATATSSPTTTGSASTAR